MKDTYTCHSSDGRGVARSSAREAAHGLRITRRHFLQLAGSGLVWAAVARQQPVSAAGYRVGLGHMTDPYVATLRAVQASGEWPAGEISGRKVVIKPNLVFPMTTETGVTTDPEVVRALVDLSLEAGAVQVRIVEGGIDGACFSACGYDFFDSYDPDGRVSLADLSQEPTVLAKVPQGMAYHWIHMPELLFGDDVFFISAAKLKTHLRPSRRTLA